MAQQPAKDLSGSNSPLEPAEIRNQLNRLLSHPLFTHSKRYPVLLEYIVEQTLLGHGADLKERTIGMEAFGREPEYDVNFDPIVRTCAAEVRKRLIQYYYDSAHAGELVIELFAGSYQPIFREPEPAKIDAPSMLSNPPQEISRPATLGDSEVPEHRHNRSENWVLLALSILLALVAGVAIGRYRPPQPLSNIDRFWKPVTSTPNPVTYCLGEPAESPELKTTSRGGTSSGGDSSLLNSASARLNVSDVLTLARTIIPLVPRHGAFRVLPASETTFEQLREGPIVLIGGFDNSWTMLLTEKLRFGFEIKDGVRRIVDRKASNHKFWALERDPANQKVVTDYALIARIHDATTGQPVIVIAGILSGGTEAASEVLDNPDYLNVLLDNAPKDWDRFNLEAVIRTHMTDGHPGPPEILQVESWQ